MSDNSTFARKEDIDKIVSTKTGLPIEQVRENTTFIVNRLKEHFRGDSYEIYLSERFGQMYCNLKTLRNKVLRLGMNDKLKKINHDEIKRLEAKSENIIIKRGENIYKKKYKHLRKRRFYNPYFTLGKSKKELEVFQNKIYYEHKKRIEGNF